MMTNVSPGILVFKHDKHLSCLKTTVILKNENEQANSVQCEIHRCQNDEVGNLNIVKEELLSILENNEELISCEERLKQLEQDATFVPTRPPKTVSAPIKHVKKIKKESSKRPVKPTKLMSRSKTDSDLKQSSQSMVLNSPLRPHKDNISKLRIKSENLRKDKQNIDSKEFSHQPVLKKIHTNDLPSQHKKKPRPAKKPSAKVKAVNDKEDEIDDDVSLGSIEKRLEDIRKKTEAIESLDITTVVPQLIPCVDIVSTSFILSPKELNPNKISKGVSTDNHKLMKNIFRVEMQPSNANQEPNSEKHNSSKTEPEFEVDIILPAVKLNSSSPSQESMMRDIEITASSNISEELDEIFYQITKEVKKKKMQSIKSDGALLRSKQALKTDNKTFPSQFKSEGQSTKERKNTQPTKDKKEGEKILSHTLNTKKSKDSIIAILNYLKNEVEKKIKVYKPHNLEKVDSQGDGCNFLCPKTESSSKINSQIFFVKSNDLDIEVQVIEEIIEALIPAKEIVSQIKITEKDNSQLEREQQIVEQQLYDQLTPQIVDELNKDLLQIINELKPALDFEATTEEMHNMEYVYQSNSIKKLGLSEKLSIIAEEEDTIQEGIEKSLTSFEEEQIGTKLEDILTSVEMLALYEEIEKKSKNRFEEHQTGQNLSFKQPQNIGKDKPKDLSIDVCSKQKTIQVKVPDHTKNLDIYELLNKQMMMIDSKWTEARLADVNKSVITKSKSMSSIFYPKQFEAKHCRSLETISFNLCSLSNNISSTNLILHASKFKTQQISKPNEHINKPSSGEEGDNFSTNFMQVMLSKQNSPSPSNLSNQVLIIEDEKFLIKDIPNAHDYKMTSSYSSSLIDMTKKTWSLELRPQRGRSNDFIIEYFKLTHNAFIPRGISTKAEKFSISISHKDNKKSAEQQLELLNLLLEELQSFGAENACFSEKISSAENHLNTQNSPSLENLYGVDNPATERISVCEPKKEYITDRNTVSTDQIFENHVKISASQNVLWKEIVSFREYDLDKGIEQNLSNSNKLPNRVECSNIKESLTPIQETEDNQQQNKFTRLSSQTNIQLPFKIVASMQSGIHYQKYNERFTSFLSHLGYNSEFYIMEPPTTVTESVANATNKFLQNQKKSSNDQRVGEILNELIQVNVANKKAKNARKSGGNKWFGGKQTSKLSPILSEVDDNENKIEKQVTIQQMVEPESNIVKSERIDSSTQLEEKSDLSVINMNELEQGKEELIPKTSEPKIQSETETKKKRSFIRCLFSFGKRSDKICIPVKNKSAAHIQEPQASKRNILGKSQSNLEIKLSTDLSKLDGIKTQDKLLEVDKQAQSTDHLGQQKKIDQVESVEKQLNLESTDTWQPKTTHEQTNLPKEKLDSDKGSINDKTNAFDNKHLKLEQKTVEQSTEKPKMSPKRKPRLMLLVPFFFNRNKSMADKNQLDSHELSMPKSTQDIKPTTNELNVPEVTTELKIVQISQAATVAQNIKLVSAEMPRTISKTSTISKSLVLVKIPTTSTRTNEQEADLYEAKIGPNPVFEVTKRKNISKHVEISIIAEIVKSANMLKTDELISTTKVKKPENTPQIPDCKIANTSDTIKIIQTGTRPTHSEKNLLNELSKTLFLSKIGTSEIDVCNNKHRLILQQLQLIGKRINFIPKIILTKSEKRLLEELSPNLMKQEFLKQQNVGGDKQLNQLMVSEHISKKKSFQSSTNIERDSLSSKKEAKVVPKSMEGILRLSVDFKFEHKRKTQLATAVQRRVIAAKEIHISPLTIVPQLVITEQNPKVCINNKRCSSYQKSDLYFQNSKNDDCRQQHIDSKKSLVVLWPQAHDHSKIMVNACKAETTLQASAKIARNSTFNMTKNEGDLVQKQKLLIDSIFKAYSKKSKTHKRFDLTALDEEFDGPGIDLYPFSDVRTKCNVRKFAKMREIAIQTEQQDLFDLSKWREMAKSQYIKEILSQLEQKTTWTNWEKENSIEVLKTSRNTGSKVFQIITKFDQLSTKKSVMCLYQRRFRNRFIQTLN